MKLTFKHFFNFSFILELFLYALNLFLAISIALNLSVKMKLLPETMPQIMPSKFYAWEFVIAFAFATLILWLILKYFKRSILLKVFFYLAIFDGLMIFSQAYFDWPYYLIVFIAVFSVWLIYNNVLMHNLVLVLAISSISVIFGINFSPNSAMIILLILAVYDFWAVYKTKQMVKMFQGLAEVKVHFALIIPQTVSGLFKRVKEVSPATEFMFLGTGDIAMPAIFTVTCLKISLLTSFFVALGAILGFISLYIIFISQKERKPMPGLPPIIFGALLGYLISFLF